MPETRRRLFQAAHLLQETSRFGLSGLGVARGGLTIAAIETTLPFPTNFREIVSE
jgi:hypothetical protein